MTLEAGSAVDVDSVRWIHGYVLELRFSDGHVSNVDFLPFLQHAGHPELRAFLDPARFRSYAVRHGNLVWGDYAMCFPIEDLYAARLVAEDHADRRVAEAGTAYGVDDNVHKQGDE